MDAYTYGRFAHQGHKAKVARAQRGETLQQQRLDRARHAVVSSLGEPAAWDRMGTATRLRIAHTLRQNLQEYELHLAEVLQMERDGE